MENDLLDSYALKARYAPALITFFPLILFISMLLYKFGLSYEAIIGSTVLSTVSLPLFLSEICRTQGKKLEDKNYKEWSGKPTTILLRKNNGYFDEITKKRIYNFVYNDFGIDLELDNSDHNISNAVKRIISYLRENKKNDLLQIHNAEYGFSRNLAGSNLLFSVQSLSLSLITCFYYLLNNSYKSIEFTSYSIIIPLTFFFLFLFSIALCKFYYPSMVKNSAFTYAHTLLESYYSCQRNQ